jgi:hypothetical protein
MDFSLDLQREFAEPSCHFNCIRKRNIEKTMTARRATLAALHVGGILFSNFVEPLGVHVFMTPATRLEPH